MVKIRYLPFETLKSFGYDIFSYDKSTYKYGRRQSKHTSVFDMHRPVREVCSGYIGRTSKHGHARAHSAEFIGFRGDTPCQIN